jgi:hypothetical protein
VESADLRLDGNALGGVLGEIFALEVTAARCICAACGAAGELGGVTVYAHGPGLVARCPRCEAILLRLVRADGRCWLDVRGVSSMELRLDV